MVKEAVYPVYFTGNMANSAAAHRKPRKKYRPAVEDDLCWKTTFSRRLPVVEDELCWILACCLLRFVAFFIIMFLC